MNKDPNQQVLIGVMVIVVICLICCGCAGIIGILATPLLRERASQPVTLKVGAAAPDFELDALGGGTVRLSQFEGQPVLLSFGATWCPPCRAEAPLVQKAHEAHPELIVLLVDMQEDAETVQQFVDEIGLTHAVLLDTSGQVSRMYHANAIPTSFFIDAGGIIRAMSVGQLTPSTLAKKLSTIGINP